MDRVETKCDWLGTTDGEGGSKPYVKKPSDSGHSTSRERQEEPQEDNRKIIGTIGLRGGRDFSSIEAGTKRRNIMV